MTNLMRLIMPILLTVILSSLTVSTGLAQDDITQIHSIQGDGSASQLIGQVVHVQAIITGDFRGSNNLSGYYLQEEDTDADSLQETSEGIFIYDPGRIADNEEISIGDLVEVTGEVREINGMTEISLSSIEKIKDGDGLSGVAAKPVTLPLQETDLLERWECMRIKLPQELIVTENGNFTEYGDVTLSPNAKLDIPTNVAEPGLPAIVIKALNDRSQILLDDGSNKVNPKIDLGNVPRCGDSVHGIEGILSYDFGRYRIQPDKKPKFLSYNPRQNETQPVRGTVVVASFNMENYFNGEGPKRLFPEQRNIKRDSNSAYRGAYSIKEFEVQSSKIIDAITDMDADIIGLMEIENDGYNRSNFTAIIDLVSSLNNSTDRHTGFDYSFIAPEHDNSKIDKLGNDLISVGIIYNSLKVEPVGKAATISTGAFSGQNRQPLAQTFEEKSTGERFTVVVNHLKSKNKPSGNKNPGLENMDIGDGQSYYNGIREKAAKDLAAWILTDPTKTGDPDFLIIGDMNSYAQEDPIKALTNAGYNDTIAYFVGHNAYTYEYNGEWGYLDHALASKSMAEQISGVTIWHINADEPEGFGYDGNRKRQDKYRSSDHDPVIIGLNLSSEN